MLHVKMSINVTFPCDEIHLLSAEVEVLLNNSVTVGSVVSLIEGTSVELNCTHPVSNASIRWQKVGDSAFVTNEPTLTLQKIQRSSAGEYRCVVDLSTGKEAEKTLTVNVLCK